MKKLISLFTVISLVLSMVVISAFAAWDGTTVATAFASGTGTEADPFVIATPEQLAFLAQSVKAGEDYEGKFVVLSADIDLGGKEWLPIGLYKYENTSDNDFPFKGSFDGKGYTVSNFVITAGNNTVYAGLFAYVTGDAVIKNVNIAKANVTGKNYAGVLVGKFAGKELSGIVVGEDCSASGTASIGGVAGRIVGAEAKYLVNHASVNGTKADSSTFAGGITGTVGGGATLSYSANYGNVTNIGAFTGGISGITGGDSGTGTLDNVVNYGEVNFAFESDKAWFVGGIAGCFGRDSGVEYNNSNLYNLGKVSANAGNTTAYVGEIVGQSRKGIININKAYSIDIEGKELVGTNSGTLNSTDVVSKTEAEIKALTAAIDAKIAENKVTPPAAPETTTPEAPETTAPSAPETNAPTTTPVKPSNPNTGDASAIILAAVCVTGLAAVMIAKKKER